MKLMMKLMAGGAGLAAFAAAAPAAAQYFPYNYGYNHNVTQMAASRCAAAVQNRLSYRGNSGILGSLFGINTRTSGRVLSVTRVDPRRSTVRVTGLATSGRYAYNRYGYGPYGMGAYGALAYSYQPDLRFSCSVDYRGYIRDIDINRR